jgi:tetratricopeptide (TPR) repeat protein
VLQGAACPAKLGRYVVRGVIEGGGMGVVLRGHDPVLNREVALKVLRERFRGGEETIRRFEREAQIAGHLQHPAIPPLYELGHADGLPFIAMKLIEGETLARLLAQRQSPSQDLPYYLTIFEQVCQALAYAHTRGVIHRDLKPSNIMVGAFGEVQIMDWGLAKVLDRRTGPAADQADAAAQTELLGPVGGLSQPGMIIGTPAYLAPEQARGELDRVDERADVFGLGAILCEILTGRPPFTGGNNAEVLYRASQGDLADALERIGKSGAERELIDIARDCLAAAPDDRPHDAGVVAARLTTYRNGVQQRLRAAEMERAAATARAEEAQARAEAETRAKDEAQARAAAELAKIRAQRRARRLALGLAALVLLALGGIGGTLLVQRNSRLRTVEELTRNVEQDCRQARELRNDGHWDKGLALLTHAEGLVGEGGPDFLRARIRQEREDLEIARTAADKAERERQLTALSRRVDETVQRVNRFKLERNWDAARGELTRTEAAAAGFPRLVDRLQTLRGELDRAQKDQALLQRVDLARVPQDLSGLKVPGFNRTARSDGPFDWLTYDIDSRRVDSGFQEAFREYGLDLDKLDEACDLVCKSAIRDQLILVLDDWYWHRRKARGANPSVLLRVADAADTNAFRKRLRQAVLKGGSQELSEFVKDGNLAKQPVATHVFLASALKQQGRQGEALGVLREARRLYPEDFVVNWMLASAYYDARPPRYREAIPYYTAAVSLRPQFAPAYLWLGMALSVDDPEAAEQAFFKVIELDPEQPGGYLAAALAQGVQTRYGDALKSAQTAKTLAGQDPQAQQLAEEMIAGFQPLAEKEAQALARLSRPVGLDDAAPLLEFAELCDYWRRYRLAARLYAKALEANPDLRGARVVGNRRYFAAWCAMLASFNDGTDSKVLTDTERTALRKQALTWLREELKAWEKYLDGERPDHKLALEVLESWWNPRTAPPGIPPPLAPSNLAKVPRQELAEWRRFDREVDAVIARAKMLQ